jgi:hypothetical protein
MFLTLTHVQTMLEDIEQMIESLEDRAFSGALSSKARRYLEACQDARTALERIAL